MKINNVFIGFIVISLLVISACSPQSVTTNNNAQDQTPPLPPGTNTGGDVTTGKTVEISMIARKFEFVPGTITVKQGDKVRLKITSQDVTHGFFLPDYGVSAELPAGKEVVVEFVAKTKGTFSFRCFVPCGEGHKAMEGTLIVE